MVRWLKSLFIIAIAIAFTGCGSARCTGDNYYTSEACPGYSTYGYSSTGNSSYPYNSGGSYSNPYAGGYGNSYDNGYGNSYGNGYGNSYGSGYDDYGY